MKEDLHLTPLSILPSITPEDNEFAISINKDYGLPLDEICWLVRDLRSNFLDSELTEVFDKEYKKKYYTYLESMNLPTDDQLFQTFQKYIKKIKIETRNKREGINKFIKGMKNTSMFLKSFYYLDQTDLITIKKCAVFGLILIHFKLYKGEPYKNKKEWLLKPTGDDNWENYMFGIVKNRLKKYKLSF